MKNDHTALFIFCALFSLFIMSVAGHTQVVQKNSHDSGVPQVQVPPASQFAGTSTKSVLAFVRNQIGDDVDQYNLCSFVYADLDNQSGPTLLASLVDGRYCNTLITIDKTGTGFRTFVLRVYNVGDVKSVVQDVARDGRRELVVPMVWSNYVGTSVCGAVWYSVYQLLPQGLTDVSAQFPDVYEARLAKLQQLNVNEMDSTGSAPCVVMETSKLKRMLGIDNNAQFALAQRWENSADSMLRSKAVDLLDDVGDQRAILELRRVSLADTDELVRTKAAVALAHLVGK